MDPTCERPWWVAGDSVYPSLILLTLFLPLYWDHGSVLVLVVSIHFHYAILKTENVAAEGI